MNTSSPQTSDVLAPLADCCPLQVADAARVFEALLSQVAALHHQGRLHRELTADKVLVDGRLGVHLTTSAEIVALTDRPELVDVCPPELQGSKEWIVPVEIEQARAAFVAAGAECDPRRIDVYQLGALLCRMLTGHGVAEYLQSPLTRGQVPAPLRPLVDGALGYNATQRITDCEQLRAAFAAAAVEATAEAAGEKKPSSFSETPVGSFSSPDQNTPVTTPPASGLQRETGNLERLGNYKIVCRIGGGGMGDVYKAYEESLDRYVAIKVLPPELARHEDFVRRFHAEATAVAKLVHPNIVQIHAIGEDAGHHYFAMQFVNGESLADLLRRRPRLPVDETLTIIEQCLQGLAAAHRQDLIHRDVKPGNILLDHDSRRAMLADFGLVKKIQDGSTLTATGVIMGTVDYIPPEQARGLPVDGRADLYSLGVLMYQMLSGRLPFVADTPTGMIFQHAYETPKPLAEVARDVPRPIAAMISRLMAKNPDDRYQSAADVLAEIAAYRSGQLAAAAGQSPASSSELFSGTPSGTADTTSFLEGDGESWRTRLLNLLRRRAPDIADRLENTQQQVDGAVYEYEQRRNHLAELVRDAEEVTAELTLQGADHRQAAEKAAQRVAAATDPTVAAQLRQEQSDCEQAAADFTRQLAEQQAQNEELQSQLAEVDGRLNSLRSQRDVLRARLRAAQAQIQIEGGVRAAPRWKKGAVLSAGAVAAIALAWFTLRFLGGDAAGQRTVDLLKLVDTKRDAVSGEWQMQRDSSLLSDSAKATVIELPYQPPEEYDFTTVFTRISGHGPVVQVCFAGGHRFNWVMDSFDGFGGFESINEKYVSQNPTTRELRLTNGQRYTSIVKVRRDGVQAYLDGKLIVEWKTDYKDMSPGWYLPDRSFLGIGTYESPTIFSSVIVVEITGHGKQTVPSSQQYKEVDLLKLVDPAWDATVGQWQTKDGELISDLSHDTRVEFLYHPPEEYDYQVVFTRVAGEDSIFQMCTARGKQFNWLMDAYHAGIGGFVLVDGRGADGNPTQVPLRLNTGQQYTSLVKVRRDGVQAYLDGKLVNGWKTDYHDMDVAARSALRTPDVLGIGTWGASTIIHSARVIEITGEGKQIVPPSLKVVHLLKLVDVKKDAVKGEWQTHGGGGGLESDSNGESLIEFPYQPPAEYDYQIEFTRVQGINMVGQICAVDARQFLWVMDHWKKDHDGEGAPHSGFTQINGKSPDANPTKGDLLLENGQRYTSVVKVRRNGVQAYLDGRLVAEWKTDYSDMTLWEGFALHHPKTLGIMTWYSQTKIHSAQVAEITGEGKLLTGP